MYKATKRRVRITIIAVGRQVLSFISMCVCACVLALVISQSNRIFSASYYIVNCGLSGSTIFFEITS